jgi:hypothetical protein
MVERGGDRCQSCRGECGLDEREELALLEPDVVGEARGELVQDGRVGRRVLGKRVGARTDGNVIAQRPRDEGWWESPWLA